MANPENIYVTVELSKAAFNAVKKSFNYFVENHHVADWAMQAFPHLDGVKAITDKIESTNICEGDSNVIIPMNKDEWIDYSSLVGYVGSVLPESWISDRVILEELSFEYADWEPTERTNSDLKKDKTSPKTRLIEESIEIHKATLDALSKR